MASQRHQEGREAAVAVDDSPTLDLLEYYRRKLLAFDGERQVWLERVAEAERQDAELIRLRWEEAQRAEDVLQLRDAARDAELHILEEHKQMMLLTAENDELRARESADRRTISDLLAMSNASMAMPSATPAVGDASVRSESSPIAIGCMFSTTITAIVLFMIYSFSSVLAPQSADFGVFTAASPWPTAASVAQRAAADVSGEGLYGVPAAAPAPSAPTVATTESTAVVAALRSQVEHWAQWAREAEAGLQAFRRDVQRGYERQRAVDGQSLAALQAEKSELQARHRALTRGEGRGENARGGVTIGGVGC